MPFMLRQIKENSINWLLYLQTVLPKLYVEDEQGLLECWAMVVVALEWCQLGRPWQPFRSFQLLPCLPHYLTFPNWCCCRRSSGGFYHDCWVMRKISSLLHHEVWRTVSPILEICPFSTLSSAPKRGEKWSFTWESFPIFSLNHFKWFDVIAADMSLGIEWADFGPWAWLMAHSINFCPPVIVDH